MDVSKTIFNTLSEFDYVKIVPYQIKKIAVKDCYTTFTNGCKKAKKEGVPFEMHYRSKKAPKQTMYIPKSAVSADGIYYTLSGKLKYAEYDWLTKEYGDCRLTKENNRWFIVVPIKDDSKAIYFDNQEGIVALDPGVRTFITYFSDDGRFGLLGYRSAQTIFIKLRRLDKLLSKKETVKDRRENAILNRKIKTIRFRIHNLIDELHWKVINYLTKNYSTILLPTYETSEMTCKIGRKLNKTSVRSMLSLRSFEFEQRLQNKCNERGVQLIRCNEAYTSKTNSFTGEIFNIGSREWFNYNGVRINRDINAARNILLRALRDDSANG